MITHQVNSLKNLYKYYVKEYGNQKLILLALIFMLIVAGSTTMMTYMIKVVINQIFINKLESQLYIMSFALLVIVVLKTTFTYVQNIIIHNLTEKTIMNIRLSLLHKVMNMPYYEINNFKKGQMSSYFMNDVQAINDSISTIFITSIKEFVTIIGLVIVVFLNNFELAIVSFSTFPIAFFSLSKMSKSIRKKYETTQLYFDTLNNKFSNILSGIKTLKAYNAEHSELRNCTLLLLNIAKKSIQCKQKASIASPVMELFSGISIIFVILYGGNQVINHGADAGSIFSFMMALIMAYRPAKALSGINVRLQTCSISVDRILNFVNFGTIEEMVTGLSPNLSIADIEFKNVCFKYLQDKESDEDINIANFNLLIKAHSKIAIVGYSGSGKSTIVNLLLGLYKIQSGEILINDINFNELSMSYVRKNISYVDQSNFIFDDTIYNNIVYGNMKKSSITQQDIDNAIQFANIDFLNDQESLHTIASNLSAGQMQRIGIARAFMKNAPILILDEATSALDSITEQKIMDNVFSSNYQKTTIIIAHRLNTITKCDQIYAIKDGEIVEHGIHEELLAKNGYYAYLWNANNDK